MVSFSSIRSSVSGAVSRAATAVRSYVAPPPPPSRTIQVSAAQMPTAPVTSATVISGVQAAAASRPTTAPVVSTTSGGVPIVRSSTYLTGGSSAPSTPVSYSGGSSTPAPTTVAPVSSSVSATLVKSATTNVSPFTGQTYVKPPTTTGPVAPSQPSYTQQLVKEIKVPTSTTSRALTEEQLSGRAPITRKLSPQELSAFSLNIGIGAREIASRAAVKFGEESKKSYFERQGISVVGGALPFQTVSGIAGGQAYTTLRESTPSDVLGREFPSFQLYSPEKKAQAFLEKIRAKAKESEQKIPLIFEGEGSRPSKSTEATLAVGKTMGLGFATGASGLVVGGVRIVLHPVQTGEKVLGFGKELATQPVYTIKGIVGGVTQSFKESPILATSELVGGLVGGFVGGKVVGKTGGFVKERTGVLGFEAKGFVSPELAAGKATGKVEYKYTPFRDVKLREVSLQRATGGESKILVERPGVFGKKIYEVTVKRAEGDVKPTFEIRKVTSSAKSINDLNLGMGGARSYSVGGIVKTGEITGKQSKITPKLIKQQIEPAIVKFKDVSDFSPESPRSVLVFEQNVGQELTGKSFPYQRKAAPSGRTKITVSKLKVQVAQKIGGRVEASPQITTVTSPTQIQKFIQKPDIVIAKEADLLPDVLEVVRPTLKKLELKSVTPEQATQEIKQRLTKYSEGVQKIEVVQSRKVALVKQLGSEGRFQYTFQQREPVIVTKVGMTGRKIQKGLTKMFETKKGTMGAPQEFAPLETEVRPVSAFQPERPVIRVQLGDVKAQYVKPVFSSRDFQVINREITALQPQRTIPLSYMKTSPEYTTVQSSSVGQDQIPVQKISVVPDLKEQIKQAQKQSAKQQQKIIQQPAFIQKQQMSSITAPAQLVQPITTPEQVTQPISSLVIPPAFPPQIVPPPIVPLIPPPLFLPSQIPSGGVAPGLYRPPRLVRQRTRYTPTATAAFLGIKGRETKGQTATGLSFRPIPTTGKATKISTGKLEFRIPQPKAQKASVQKRKSEFSMRIGTAKVNKKKKGVFDL